jgi:putative endonuclease
MGYGSVYTKSRRPFKLVFLQEFESIDIAYRREKQVQGWSRKKKEALINGQYNELPNLSKNYSQFPPRLKNNS